MGVSSQVYTEVHLWSTPGQSGVYTGVMPIDGMKKVREKPAFVYPLIWRIPRHRKAECFEGYLSFEANPVKRIRSSLGDIRGVTRVMYL